MIPRSINIFGEKYKVIMTDNPTYDGDDCYGVFHALEKTIELKKGLDFENLISTFFHECFHAVSYETGIQRIVANEVDELYADNCSKMVAKYLKKIFEDNQKKKEKKKKVKKNNKKLDKAE